MTIEYKEALWLAVNAYTETCGGNPGSGDAPIGRAHAVVEVEKVVDSLLDPFRNLVGRHMMEQGIIHGSTLEARVRGILEEYKNRTAEALADRQRDREDTRVFLRAIGLLVATCGNADTHREKNARLRAVSEMIESAVEKLAGTTAEFMCGRDADLFRADYPTRHLVDKIRELHRQLEQYQKQEEPQCQNPKPNDDVPM